MKPALLFRIFIFFLNNLQSQVFNFVDQTNFLPSPSFHSENVIGVCDMNREGKDDIVGASYNSTISID